MLRYSSVPLFFLALASVIGLILRFHFISPLPWLTYPYWLHAHSHLMFLGWVTNVLYLAFTTHYVPVASKQYRTLFIVIQFILAGMLISFPLQGYGAVSITLSTLHTFSICLFTWWIYKDTSFNDSRISLSFARKALFFFILSSLGPFSLGALMANGLGHTQVYYSAIYFYLHFQYNGVFIFGCFSLFFYLLEERNLPFHIQHAKTGGLLLFVACFPTYALSVLWTSSGLIVNIIGFLGALLQLLSAFYIWKSVYPVATAFLKNFVRPAKVLLGTVVLAYVLKLFLQLLSALPTVALLAYNLRNYIIAYLHLVLVGIVTFFLLFWLFAKGLLPNLKRYRYTLYTLILPGFVGLELMLLLRESQLHNISYYLFGFSFLLSIGFILTFIQSFKGSN